MMFSENLQYLRKKDSMTQEQLAEKLGVSRQAVSKWEAGAAYPEMDKIVAICDMFGMNIDTLINGDAEKSVSEDTEGYDLFYNRSSRAMAFGVFLILAGVALLVAMSAFGLEKLGLVVFFALLTVSVVIFIWFGIRMDDFRKKHRSVNDFYSTKERESFKRKFAAGMASGVGLILFGVLIVVGASFLGMDETLSAALLLTCVSFAAAGFVYFGMQSDKYNIDKYNGTDFPGAESEKTVTKKEKYNGVIMLSATALFFALGFIFQLWYIAWVVFPIGGIFCGIVSTALQKTRD